MSARSRIALIIGAVVVLTVFVQCVWARIERTRVESEIVEVGAKFQSMELCWIDCIPVASASVDIKSVLVSTDACPFFDGISADYGLYRFFRGQSEVVDTLCVKEPVIKRIVRWFSEINAGCGVSQTSSGCSSIIGNGHHDINSWHIAVVRDQVELPMTNMNRSTNGNGQCTSTDLISLSGYGDLSLSFGHSLPTSPVSALSIHGREHGSAGGNDAHNTGKFPVGPFGALVILIVGASVAVRNWGRGADWLFFCGWGASVLGFAGVLDAILRFL